MLLLYKELPQEFAKKTHPSLFKPGASRLTPVFQQELNRIATGMAGIGGIDLSRYETSEDLSPESSLESVQGALRTTYANIAYLSDRQANIALLEEYGKNSWLIGNSHLDDLQRRLDNELESVKARSEETNVARKALQEDARGELLGLTDTWKQGIDKIIQTQLATDALNRDFRRQHAPSSSG